MAATCDPPSSASSADSIHIAFGYRSAGFLAIARSITGCTSRAIERSGRTAASDGTGSETCASMTPSGVSATYGGRPASSSKQDHTRRVDVRPRVHAFRLGLLGRHVRGCSEDDPDARQVLGRARRVRALEELRRPEVEKPDVIGVIGQRLQEDVGGLQVAVSDHLAVGEGQPAQRLADDVESARRRHGPFVDQIRQRLPLQQLHHQVRHIAVDPKVGDRDDVGVRQRREHPRLALETATPLGRLGRALLQHLDRHQPIELHLPALVDHTDAADAQPRQHFIASVQGPTDERIRYGRRWEQVYAHEPSLYIPDHRRGICRGPSGLGRELYESEARLRRFTVCRNLLLRAPWGRVGMADTRSIPRRQHGSGWGSVGNASTTSGLRSI